MRLALLILFVERLRGKGALAGDHVAKAAAAGRAHGLAGARSGDERLGLARSAAGDVAQASAAGRVGHVAPALLGGAQDLALARLVALGDLAGSAGGGPHVARAAASGGEHLPIG